jgi:hypothetical protein
MSREALASNEGWTGDAEVSYVANIQLSEKDIDKMMSMFTPEEREIIEHILAWVYKD